MVYTTQGGRGILLDMPRAVHLRDGDGLALDSGELVRVEAAPEPLIEITAPNMPLLLRLAWHLGNRHLPTQLLGDGMRLRHDHRSEERRVGKECVSPCRFRCSTFP